VRTQDQAAGERADRCIEAMSSPDRCTYCDGEFDGAPHVDALHRFTRLCGSCYEDEHRRAVTARRLSDTEPKTPHDWDRKIKKIYGKTLAMRLALLLDDYMKFRASKEGVAYDLDPQFFLNATGKGIWNFFGITADPETGTLTEDFQNPPVFEEWSNTLRSGRISGFEAIDIASTASA
jgi:hypothetical protein